MTEEIIPSHDWLPNNDPTAIPYDDEDDDEDDNDYEDDGDDESDDDPGFGFI